MNAICPADGTPLQPASSNRKIAYCKQCLGCWVDGKALHGMIAGSHADAAERKRLFDTRVALCKPAERICPEHRDTMSRFVYRAIDLDICPRCKGVWFDSGELKRLTAPTRGRATAVAAGAAAAALGGAALAGHGSAANRDNSESGDSAVEGVLDVAAAAISVLDFLSLF